MCVSVCVIFENYLAADNCCAFTVSVFIFLLDEKSDEGFLVWKAVLLLFLLNILLCVQQQCYEATIPAG